MFNSVILVGNLTRDPEIRYLPDGKGVGTFTVATNRKYGDKEEVFFGSVTVFGKQADNCAQYLKKGSKVLVQGRLRTEKYEKDGEQKTSTKIIADQVKFMSSKPDGGATGAPEETIELEPF